MFIGGGRFFAIILTGLLAITIGAGFLPLSTYRLLEPTAIPVS
jgi:hypothetical protein